MRVLYSFTVLIGSAAALGQTPIVNFDGQDDSLFLADGHNAISIHVDNDEWPGVIRAANDLALDFGRVTGLNGTVTGPNATTSHVNTTGHGVIVVGTLGHSAIIDKLVEHGRLNVSSIQGQWEAFQSAVIRDPVSGVREALVIVGSDKRGSIYGLYDVSEQIGVSPWYYWADVASQRKDAIYALRSPKIQKSPSVKYRGIFINDEAPALSGYIRNHFPDVEYGAGYNADFYATVFELMLRLRSNYLWPAMWGSMFNYDDPRNQPLADEYGIVMGTSHTEPLACATKEWGNFGEGAWDWRTNNKSVEPFLRDCAQRAKPYETLYTMGMRGYDDTALSPGTEIDLLEEIVAAQRKILSEVNDGKLVPQVWTLYEEVMDYYTQGMEVPDDIILMFADDNWGNIRRMPMANETGRSGSFGMYYHFDLVGDPRAHKWINTQQLERTWEQMHTAYERGIDALWVVNVGDLKPQEIPINYFLDLAYDIDLHGPDTVSNWLNQWAAREFGVEFADEAAAITHNFTFLTNRRVPEALDGMSLQGSAASIPEPSLGSSAQRPETYSILNYGEAERVLAEWRDLAEAAESLYDRLPESTQPSFFQMVLHPIKAIGAVHEIIIGAAQNRMYAEQGRNMANVKADHVMEMFDLDNQLMEDYNGLLDGKWDGIMDQTHLGYTYWQVAAVNLAYASMTLTNYPRQQPMRQFTPPMSRVHPRQRALFGDMGITPEGSRARIPGDDRFHALNAVVLPLPTIDPYSGSTYFDIYSTGPNTVSWNVTAESFVKLTVSKGELTPDTKGDARVYVTLDWANVPSNSGTTLLNFTSSSGYGTQSKAPSLEVHYNRTSVPDSFAGHIEGGGHLAIEPEHFSRITKGSNSESSNLTYLLLPSHGRTLSALTLNDPLAPPLTPSTGPALEYDFYKFTPGSGTTSTSDRRKTLNLTMVMGTGMNAIPTRHLAFAVQFDDGPPRRVEYIGAAPPGRGARPKGWTDAVFNAAWVNTTTWADELGVGKHTLRVWLLEPSTVLTRIVVDFGGVRDSYLGPPESVRV